MENITWLLEFNTKDKSWHIHSVDKLVKINLDGWALDKFGRKFNPSREWMVVAASNNWDEIISISKKYEKLDIFR